jgi:amino acid transporter
MGLRNIIFGEPLASHEEGEQKVGVLTSVSILGLDGLSSAAYGPEAALTVLIPLGALGVGYGLPITLSIVALMLIVYTSYRQTLAAYPSGGGAYTVARLNLGTIPSLLSAVALLLDYVLVVAVGISAGVGALVSAFPQVQPYTLAICLAILTIITLINLRGVKESGAVFVLPTYLFVSSLGFVIVLGVVKAILAGGQPVPVEAPPQVPAATAAAGLWLLLHAFASGCTAMTGVEAVSNGVSIFRAPVVENARKSLSFIIGILALLLVGIAYLANVYHIGATEPGKEGYQSVLSMLIAAVVGKGVLYYVAITSILLVLAFSANTGFADFPRLCRAIAQNGYMPRFFASRGRRLVYSSGIVLLAVLSGLLLIIFNGITDRLIPLFAIGAFLAFTLSQAGMVVHWKRNGGANAVRNMFINGIGAVATGITLLVIAVQKFADGAWIMMLLIPSFLLLFGAVRRHYHRVAVEISEPKPLATEPLLPPIVIIPINDWNRISHKGLRFAMRMSQDVCVVHIKLSDKPSEIEEDWEQLIAEPARRIGAKPPRLVTLHSPYRYVINPFLDYVLSVCDESPEAQIAVIVPELITRKWYQRLLHNQRASWMKAMLLVRGDDQVIVVNIPWYLSK